MTDRWAVMSDFVTLSTGPPSSRVLCNRMRVLREGTRVKPKLARIALKRPEILSTYTMNKTRRRDKKFWWIFISILVPFIRIAKHPMPYNNSWAWGICALRLSLRLGRFLYRISMHYGAIWRLYLLNVSWNFWSANVHESIISSVDWKELNSERSVCCPSPISPRHWGFATKNRFDL